MALRTPQKRTAAAHCVLRQNEGVPASDFRGMQLSKNGILGHPIVLESPSFHGSYSFVPDLMHVVLLGFLKAIVGIMFKTWTYAYNLRHSRTDDFRGLYR
jgi:hypothetical protein